MRRGSSEYEYKYTQISQEYQTKITTYETKIKQVILENDEYKRKLQEVGDQSRKIPEYEKRIILLS